MVLRTLLTGLLLAIDVNIWSSGQRSLFFANACFARVDTGIPTDFNIHGLQYIPEKFVLEPNIPNNFSLLAAIQNVSIHTNIPNSFAIQGIPEKIGIHLEGIPGSFNVDIKLPKSLAIDINLPDWIQPVGVAFKYLLYAIAAAIVVLVLVTSCTFVFVPNMRILRTLICGCFLALATCFKDFGQPESRSAIKAKLQNAKEKGTITNQMQPYFVHEEKYQNIYDKMP